MYLTFNHEFLNVVIMTWRRIKANITAEVCFTVQLSAVIESIQSSPEGACIEDLHRRSTVGVFWYQLVKLSDLLASLSGADRSSLVCVTVGLRSYVCCNK